MSDSKPAQAQQDYRLPTDVRPTHYDLTVWTDLENNKFEGIVHIDLRVNKDTSTIVLNTANLELGDVSLRTAARADTTQAAAGREFDAANERGIFSFPKALDAGAKARLSVTFKGELTGDMLGYYRSTGGKDGDLKYTLTQFEPTAARRAFPSWDEPLLKATFAVTLVSRVNSVNLSNMPAASEEVYKQGGSAAAEKEPWIAQKLSSLPDPEQWKITQFETTPPVSTYLVAYANGPFEYLESSYKSPLSGKVRPLRIYATADVISQAQFALDVKRIVLPLYEQVFEVEYPLPKLDTLVASDFDSGAMENWGLITGRTQCFLLDPNSADIKAKQDVASVQSHEVAHMWFGNITTMEWWDNLYLNEVRVFPEWKLDAQFLGAHFYRARALDAKLSSHPIEVECPDANMINQIFDHLSYAKAGSVLRMLASYVGEERFLKGVSIYLKEHQFKNAVTKDLWAGIQAATDLDIPKMMDNWVKKATITLLMMGYPVVTVTEKEGGIHVRQDRFLETGPADPKDNETIWTIPLNLLTVGADGKATLNKDILLDEREKFIPLDTGKPFKLNAETTGFYAVQYSADRLVKLGQQTAAEGSPFSLSDRIGLVSDALALSKAGYTSVSSALGLIDALHNEKEHLVWDAIATNLSTIVSTWWEHPHIVDLLNAIRRELFVPIVKRLGFEYKASDPYDDIQLRTTAIEQAAEAGDAWYAFDLKDRFDHFLKTGDDSKIPADLTSVTFRVAVQEGGRPEWEAVKRIAAKAKNPSQGLSAMRAMGASRDPALAEATFAFIMDGARDQDTFYYAGGLARNFATRRFLADKFREHFAAFEKRYAGNFGLIRWTEISFGGFSSEKDYEETVAFFKDKDTSKFDMALNQTLDTIKSRAAWVERSTDELTQWLEKRQSSNLKL
ncbi:leucyl aminopeptidase [Trametes elegans]|nr:leucyl aminopeptidase [Trametes elegans]